MLYVFVYGFGMEMLVNHMFHVYVVCQALALNFATRNENGGVGGFGSMQNLCWYDKKTVLF